MIRQITKTSAEEVSTFLNLQCKNGQSGEYKKIYLVLERLGPMNTKYCSNDIVIAFIDLNPFILLAPYFRVSPLSQEKRREENLWLCTT